MPRGGGLHAERGSERLFILVEAGPCGLRYPLAMKTLSLLALLPLFACTASKDADTAAEPSECAQEEPACVDAMIQDLSLHDDKVSNGEVVTVTDGEDFVTSVDASAGGYQRASNNPFVYLRFTDAGAEKISIDDDSALSSTDWHLSLRRFIVRVNSGDSGPSCVGAAGLRAQTYEEVSSVPEGLSFREDDYYTDDCTLVNDSSGLPGSPQVAMGAWWSYTSCLETTGTPFLIQLEDGRVVKLRIETYYGGDGQTECNEGGSTTAEGGYLTLRWRFMD